MVEAFAKFRNVLHIADNYFRWATPELILTAVRLGLNDFD